MPERGLVMIVADDEPGTDALEKLLVDTGYSVVRRNDRAGALRVAEETGPNLVLIDTRMSRDDPFALRDDLRESRLSLDVPIVFLTTRDDAEARVKGLELGDDLILKPYEEREVLTRVERHVTVSKVRMALRESEAKFRSVMESAIDAIISADSKGDIRSWNSAATALFGFTEDEVVGRPIEVIIPERFRDPHHRGIQRVTSGGPSHVIGKTVELAALRKDGSEFPVELSLATWFLDDARYFTGIIRDISERKQAEEKFRSVTDSAIDAIISADQTGVIVGWNQAATRILEYTEQEATGQRLEIIIPERFHEAHRQGMQRVTETGKGHVIGTTVELAARTKSGAEVPIELSLSTWTVRDERYYTGIIRDIGERKRAEEALRQSEQALRESTDELTRKNEALEDTLNQLHDTRDQLIMQEKMASLGRLSAGMAHELNNPASAAQRGASQLQGAFLAWQKTTMTLGEQDFDETRTGRLAELDRLAKERACQLDDLDGLTRSDREEALEKWFEDHDFTEVWQLVPQIVSLGLEEEDLDTLEGVFSPQQFPLVVDWLSSTQTIYNLAEEIGVGTARIVEIVKALKTYTYMDQAPIQSVDVREGLDNTLIILHNKLKRGITVQREYAADLPMIQAHGGELNQVWTNLIDNAIDAMGGKGTLTVRARHDGDHVVVHIEDDGPGIPESIQRVIFDPFFTTKPPGVGSGLGLNISRNIVVQKHNGDISVTSKPGQTCFAIRLPVKHEPRAHAES